MKTAFLLVALSFVSSASVRGAEAPIEKLRTVNSDAALIDGIAAMPEDELESLTEYWAAKAVFQDASSYASQSGAETRQLWYGAERLRIVFELKYGRDRVVDRALRAIRNVDWQIYRDMRTPDLAELISLSVAVSVKIEKEIANRWKEIKTPTRRPS